MSFGKTNYWHRSEKLAEFELSSNDAYEARCGEVFVTFKRLMVFHCSFCDSKYGSFENFLEHLSLEHNEQVKDDVSGRNNRTDKYSESEDEDLFSEIEDYDCHETKPTARPIDETEHAPGIDSENFQCVAEIKDEVMYEENVVDESSYLLNTEYNDDFKEEAVSDGENNDEEIMYEEVYWEKLEERENLEVLQASSVEFQEQPNEDHLIVQDKVINATNRGSQQLSLSPSRLINQENSPIAEIALAAKTDVGPNLFKCEICKKVFTEKRFLRKHHEIHCTERKYKCGICGLAFKTYTNAYAHMRRHQLEKKKINCDFCPRTFFTRTEAASHMRMHTGERPYICSFCGLGFQTSSKLTSHTRLHTEEVMKCSFCDKNFFGKKALHYHMLIHTKEKPFSCSFCTATFARRKSLVRHLKKHES